MGKEEIENKEKQKGKGDYTKTDLFFDILFWIPEVIILPIRILFWSFRGVLRWVTDVM